MIPTTNIIAATEAMAKQLDTNTADKLRAAVSKVLQFTKLPNGNLPSHLHKAANELRKDRDIVILPLNKSNVTVVMDRKEYTEKLKCMLEDGMYSKLRKVPSSIESRVTQALKKRIHH